MIDTCEKHCEATAFKIVIKNLEHEVAKLKSERDEIYGESQKPVAYINVEERKLEWAKPISWNTPTTIKLDKIPLYTHPPQRTWVGLTDEEIEDCWDGYLSDYQLQMIREMEAKLKEKNT